MTNDIQKALHYHEAVSKKNFALGTRIVLEKLDGWYCYIDCIDGKWDEIRSRVHRVIPSLRHLSERFAASPPLNFNGRLICEVIIPSEPFHIANGILNRKDEIAKDATLVAHDLVYFDYTYGAYERRYSTMMFACNTVMQFLNTDGVRLSLAPILAIVDDEDKLFAIAQDVMTRGGEGVIAKDAKAPYSFGKRNADILKIKQKVTLDVLVSGLESGKGKYAGSVGALIVQRKDGKTFTVSGMTDEQRAAWLEYPEAIIGSVVEIEGMLELPNGALREPRFKAIRHDKSKQDID